MSRRLWRCRRCGRTHSLVGPYRDASAPTCSHAHTPLEGLAFTTMRPVPKSTQINERQK